MNDITLKKLAGLNNWAAYHGFSFLFDNPGDNNYHPLDCGVIKIDCKEDEKKTLLYAKAFDTLSDLIPEFPNNGYLFCRVPLSSYHVTFWDGVTDSNIIKLENHSDIFKNYLMGFKKSLRETQPFHDLLNSDLQNINSNVDIEFEFDQLDNWGDQVLVARLKSTNESASNLKELIQKRKGLTKKFITEYGNVFMDGYEKYSPHFTLGYFANKEYGKLFTKDLLNELGEIFKNKLINQTIKFSSIGLYGFTDMTTFFK